MANETRPRRESTGNSRIRKTSPSSTAPTSESPGGPPSEAAATYPGAAESTPAPVESVRNRQDREPFREEAPADREPIRFIRERDREPVRDRPEREQPTMTVRERLARDRSERDGGPIHHEGIPMARDRDRDRDTSPVVRERADGQRP
jgi:transcription termination factor Rho